MEYPIVEPLQRDLECWVVVVKVEQRYRRSPVLVGVGFSLPGLKAMIPKPPAGRPAYVKLLDIDVVSFWFYVT